MSDRRGVIRLHLERLDLAPGEIALADLARVAKATQEVVHRFGRGLVDQRRPGRSTALVETATKLTFVGISVGSTILELAGPEPLADGTLEFDVPTDLGELSVQLFVDGFAAIAASDSQPQLPIGFDRAAAQDMDEWLRALRGFDAIEIEANLRARNVRARATPFQARARLGEVEAQPSMPYVSRTNQVLDGVLYALNVHTGTFSIEDDAGHKIRLRLPTDMRADAALLVTRRVRAIGIPELDASRRLTAFIVSRLDAALVGDLAGEQARFYERHDLIDSESAFLGQLDDWAIPDLTEEESAEFLAAIADLR